MTTQTERLRDALLAAENSDPEALRPLLARAVVWHTPGHNLLSGDHLGQEQSLMLLREYKRLTGGTFHVDPKGESATTITLHATARRGKEALDLDTTVRFTLEDGKVSELWTQPRDQAAWDRFWAP